MTDLVKQLNTHFCEELNTAWLKCCKGNGVKDWTVATFRDICRLLAEAREQGYQFNLEYSPNLFIEERIIGKDLEAEFCTLPEWEEVGVVINSLRMAEDRSMDQMIPRLQELKSQYMRPVLLKYAITCSREHGGHEDVSPSISYFSDQTRKPMPANKNAIIRHRIIDQCINDRRRRYPTLEYLADRCSEMLGTDISTSTIEKDIAVMKREPPVGYNAPIVYSKQNRGYAYGEAGFSIAELNLQDEEWDALRFAAQLLYQYRDVPVFNNFKNAIERINTRFSLGIKADDPILDHQVQFETANSASGMGWIDMIYGAIRNGFPIGFSYQNIYKKKTATYHINPYLLKEHRNRWYVTGWCADRNDYLTFALDRIQALEVTSANPGNDAKQRAAFRANSFFQNATGIMTSKGKAVRVELIIRDPISKLVLLEPLHASQKLISEKKDEIRISMGVYLNEEFYLRLLSLGPWCSVVKPAALGTTMKQMVQQMNRNYS